MDRKIVFRGYNLKNKKWLYGYYLVNRGKHFIVQDEVVNPFEEESEDFEVDPESVGQYVGTYKGVHIFEKDIVAVEPTDNEEDPSVGVVKYDNDDCRFVVEVDEFYLFPVSGEMQMRIEGMEIQHDFYYKYDLIGNEYEKKLKISNP